MAVRAADLGGVEPEPAEDPLAFKSRAAEAGG